MARSLSAFPADESAPRRAQRISDPGRPTPSSWPAGNPGRQQRNDILGTEWHRLLVCGSKHRDARIRALESVAYAALRRIADARGYGLDNLG